MWVAALSDAVERARANSPFLAMLLGRESVPTVETLDYTPAIDPAVPVSRALRLARRHLALHLALGDLAGLIDLDEVTGALTAFADRALDIAIRAAIEERTPGTEPVGFVALALGKQGAGELNYSSDIDPVLLFDPATLPRRRREEPEEAAVRIARRVVELLQSRDGDGYVFRVDLRLRPSPEVTPIAIPVDAAITYYESQALPWERAAFIKARAAAGDLVLGRRFLETIQPFVWRRSLDFGAIGEIVGITRRIREHYAQGQAFGPGYDLKRGRGGIREIEFFAQVHQLIHGGRDAALRAPATRDALAALARAGRIDPDDAAALSEAYRTLRTIEHRVQMIDDRQTHALPNGEALNGVARLHGLADGEALLTMLRPHVAGTARIYAKLADEGSDTLPEAREPLVARLALLKLSDADRVADLVERWRSGRYPALRSAAAKEALEAALPIIAEAFAGTPDPSPALAGFDRLLERLPSAINFFRLIEARPGLVTSLATILAHAPTLAAELGRRSDLLDGLIDASAMDDIGTSDDLTTLMRGGTRDDYQGRLDHVRIVVGEKRFALGVRIVLGASDPLAVAHDYSRLADAANEVLAHATVEAFVEAHGRVPESELLILALGRLGGSAMTHASDLDLIYLFTGDFRAQSDGEKPLGATLYYNRLAQRVTAALSVPTAAGPLYEVDTRLRPSGAQGPLVVSLDSFERYQREDAWTWEHMALTRARPVFGSRAGRDGLRSVIEAVLADGTERDIAADARAMRAEMATHKPPAGPLDAKLLPGGLVDLEFAVHVAQLVHRTAFHPELGRAIDALTAQGVLPTGLRNAHDLLTRMLVTLRLVAPDARMPDAKTGAIVARALRLPDWEAVLAAFASARDEVLAISGDSE